MLGISQPQMDTMGAYTEQRFVMSMVRHMRSKFTERAAGLTDEVLERLVRKGMREAEDHQVVFESDIRRYLEYMVIYGAPLAQLPNAPWLGDILSQPELSAAERLDQIGEYELALIRGQDPGEHVGLHDSRAPQTADDSAP